MRTAFLDESGDLNFDHGGKNVPRYFVVSVIICDKIKVLDRVVRSVFLSIKKNMRDKRSGRVFHANKERDGIKRKMMSLLAKTNVEMTSIILDKREHESLTSSDKHELYTFLAYEALEASGAGKCERIVLSRREKKRVINEKMVDDLECLLGVGDTACIREPHVLSGLQAVDFLAHAVFSEYEFGKRWMHEAVSNQDKTLAAFCIEHNPAPEQQGNYLSYFEYSKRYRKSKGKV